MKTVGLCLGFFVITFATAHAAAITPNEAASHVGQTGLCVEPLRPLIMRPALMGNPPS